MFNGNRKFDGRQGYQILNKELYLQYEVLKNLLAESEQETDVNGSLWLDRTTYGNAKLKYRNGDTWENIFDKYFKLIEDIRSDEEPIENNILGKLWIDSNGVMYYFDGTIYKPVKASNVDISDLSINASAFENFMLIDPLTKAGSYIVNDSSTTEPTKSQFLIPSERTDKVFMEGNYISSNAEYEVQSNICIEMENSLCDNKNLAAVHVNPGNLKAIIKRIAKIDSNGTINIPSANTEYYGIVGDTAVFLHRNTTTKKKDYSITANGIQLNRNADNNFDYQYIYCITYEFENSVKNRGTVIKNTLNLSNRTEVYIGANRVSPLVFAQGLQVDNELYSYDSDKDTILIFKGYDANGDLTLDIDEIEKPLFSDKTDLAVLEISKQTNNASITNITSYTVDSKTKYKGTVSIPSDYVEPIIFIQGLMIKPDNKTSQEIEDIDSSNPSCVIVDMCDKNNDSFFVSSGTVGSDLQIPVTDDIASGESNAILFINGLYISTTDYDKISNPGYIKVSGMVEGLEYTLFKCPSDKEANIILYDGTISFSTITYKKDIDDAIVYFNEKAIVDENSCSAEYLNDRNAINNEIRKFIISGSIVWKIYDAISGEWKTLEDEEANKLSSICSGYSLVGDTISILKSIDKQDVCSILAYTYANRIEEPLLKGTCSSYITREIDGVTYAFYEINRNFHYTKNKNSLQVWLYGIKQRLQEYEIMDGDVTIQGFLVREDLVKDTHPTFYYIIEEPEANESRSFIYEDITTADSNTIGIYHTNTNLFPGVVTLYVDGYRQPNTSYTILSSDSLAINPPFPVTSVHTGQLKYTPQYTSTIEIEVRRDYSLCEQSIVLDEEFIDNNPNQLVFSMYDTFNGKSLSNKLFQANKSEINIFINGANYGDDFEKYDNLIVLTNNNVLAFREGRTNSGSAYLNVGDTITFEWR